RVAACVAAMRDACALPVTVKHRIGIDDMESYQQLLDFVVPSAEAGCTVFVVHARKAWLQGLSPKENREVPPLNYPWVHRLKADLPQLTIVVNGGITTLEECRQQLAQVDGVMLGRAAYHDPWLLADVDRVLFGADNPLQSRHAVIEQMLPYVARELAAGTRLNHITRHLLGLYQGLPGARQFRRHISENAHRKGAGIEVLERAYSLVRDAGERQQTRNSAA
ncbi:MAG: tRNA dihydrouridine(20/20a) synthase DusA, partial [Haliea sp.]